MSEDSNTDPTEFNKNKEDLTVKHKAYTDNELVF